MLWFLNNEKTNPNGMIDFYQVFIDSTMIYSDEETNTIYSFDSNNQISSVLNLDISKHKSNNINCKIKIIDHIISYDIINENENKNYVFTIKTNFICPQDNQYNIPIFAHTYKKVNNKRLPNLIETKYTNIYELNFQVYNIDTNNNQIQFVIETNPLTNEKRKYFIVPNLNLIQNYIIIK
jgi:hypothetical protein